MSLSQNMFSPALSTGVARRGTSTVKARLSTPVRYYVPDGAFTPDQVKDLALACAVACTNENAPLDAWKSLIATYTNLLFDGIVTKLPRDQFTAHKLSRATLDALHSRFLELDEESDAIPEDQTTGLGVGAFSGYYLDWTLPRPSDQVAGGWGTYCRDEKSLHAHYALLVFLAGKEIDPGNRAPITMNRPKALISKYDIQGVEILNGSLRISDHGHGMVFQSWLEMSSLKAECFREFSTYTNSSTSLGQDIIMTNVTLMRFSQMAHATIIHKFLLAYPWATELGYLRQSVALFMDSLNTAAKIEPHLQPYVKIIWGDKSGLFPRKDLGPLIAVALDTEKDVHETLASYYSDERFASVVEAFRDERARRDMKKQPPAHPAPTPDDDTDEEGEEAPTGRGQEEVEMEMT